MHSSLPRRAAWAALLALLPMAGLAQPVPADAPFLKGNAVAMDRMMAAMSAKPSGDVDRDFVATMQPHHQGAIDMAQGYLRWGRNEQLRRMPGTPDQHGSPVQSEAS